MITATNDYNVIDKNGKRVRRTGILQDGDRITVMATLMDTVSPDLIAAMAAADSAKRIEQFDAKATIGHRPGFAVLDDTARDASAKLISDRNDRISNAWRNPSPVVDQQRSAASSASTNTPSTRDELFSQRDRRLESAWRGA